MQSLFVVLVTLVVAGGTAVAGGKTAKKGSKSAPTDGEPWVAGYTLTQWVELYRSGDAKQKERAAEMIGWCCTQRKSVEAAKAMIEVLQDERHRLIACKALARMHFDGRTAAAALVSYASKKESSAETRMAALDALGSIGVTKPGVLEVLMEGVRDPDDGISRTAGYAVSRMGADARPLVAELIAALNDPDTVIAESAAAALSGIGPDAKEAGPALILALRHPDARVRRHSAEAIQRLHSDDPVIHKALIAAVKDRGNQIEGAAVWALHFCRNIDEDVVEALCWALQHGDESTRYYAANALSEHGIHSDKTVKPLILALDTLKIRSVAATALGKRRPVKEATLSALMAAFEKGHYERIAIANALAEMGPEAESTARRLKEALSERRAEGSWSYELIYVAVAEALWKTTKDREMIPLLAKLARYRHDHHVSGRALAALGEMGPDAKAAIPELISALEVPGGNWSVARALVKIGAPEGEAALRKMLEFTDRDKRLQAAHVLWDLKKDDAALAELAAIVRTHPDRFVRRHAVMALGTAAPDDELAILHLAAALEDDCPYVQKAAAKALVRCGAEARPTVRTLARLLTSDSWSVAEQAAQTLGALGPVAVKALPELRKASENPLLRASAVEAIKKISR